MNGANMLSNWSFGITVWPLLEVVSKGGVSLSKHVKMLLLKLNCRLVICNKKWAGKNWCQTDWVVLCRKDLVFGMYHPNLHYHARTWGRKVVNITCIPVDDFIIVDVRCWFGARLWPIWGQSCRYMMHFCTKCMLPFLNHLYWFRAIKGWGAVD